MGLSIHGLAVAGALLVLWLIVDPRTPDLAGQVYRVDLFGRLGFAVWDEHWYAGHDLPGYSLLFPPLASLVGLRLTAGLALLASAALGERLLRALYGPAGRWGAVLLAAAAAGDVWIGRLAFALGVAFALAAGVAIMSGRRAWAALAGVGCAAASPVAGALLALAGMSVWVGSGRAREIRRGRALAEMLVLVAPAGGVLLALGLLFPEGGWEPFALLSLVATLLVVAAFLVALPPGQPSLRGCAVVYLLVCLLSVAVHTPLGSNVQRYAVLLAGPLLLCASLAAPVRRRLPVLAGALLAWGVWVAWGPLREGLAVGGSDATSAAYYAPVERFLASRADRGPVRLEVPLTRSHWEAALLAPRVSLARGWEKQLDERYNRVLLSGGLTAAGFARWLREQAVSYVALPDAKPDPSSATEGRLIRSGLPYLRPAFASRHWRIYEVLAPGALAAGPGRLVALGHDYFTLHAERPGRFLVRVRFSRYLTVTKGSGCVSSAPSGWTEVLARAPGTLVVRARFSLARALSLGGSCRASVAR